jgi:hypothetical protein
MAVTYNDLYLDIRRALIRAGTAAASLEARTLLCFATGKSQEMLLRDLICTLQRRQKSRFAPSPSGGCAANR